jgi:D-sedoheptulose 7-phosphate isomerase
MISALKSKTRERFETIVGGIASIESFIGGELVPFDDAVDYLVNALRIQRDRAATCWLIGNGGSGSIADHIACDMVLQGVRAHALTNPALTTTMGNDFGAHRAYSKQLQVMAHEHDTLIAMSCSGESDNILNALTNAPPLFRVTLSGFKHDNLLRSLSADVDFWVPSEDYGVVQIAHLAILHTAVDLARMSG